MILITKKLAKMIFRKQECLCFASFLILISFGVRSSQLAVTCDNSTTYNVNTSSGQAYRDSLETLLSSLASQGYDPSGFYNDVSGSGQATVYGLFLCRGDVAPNVCQDCLETATKQVLQNCTNETRAVVWYDYCMVRFSDQTIRSRLDASTLYQWTLGNASNVPLFNQVLGHVFDKIVALAISSSVPEKKFAVAEAKYMDFDNVYALGQCTPDLSDHNCEVCLRTAISALKACCAGRMASRIFAPSCNIRHEMYRFYNITDPPTS